MKRYILALAICALTVACIAACTSGPSDKGKTTADLTTVSQKASASVLRTDGSSDTMDDASSSGVQTSAAVTVSVAGSDVTTEQNPSIPVTTAERPTSDPTDTDNSPVTQSPATQVSNTDRSPVTNTQQPVTTAPSNISTTAPVTNITPIETTQVDPSLTTTPLPITSFVTGATDNGEGWGALVPLVPQA